VDVSENGAPPLSATTPPRSITGSIQNDRDSDLKLDTQLGGKAMADNQE